MITATLGETVLVHFPVFEADTETLDSGLGNGDFTKVLVRNSSSSAVVVTVAEVGATGYYVASFVPDAVGRWFLSVRTPAGGMVVEEILVTVTGKVICNFAYNPSTSTLEGNIWLERDGQLVASVTSATATFYSSTGTALFAALSDLSPDAQGIFRVTQASPAGFSQGAEIYAVVSIVAPSGTFTTVKGIQVVG